MISDWTSDKLNSFITYTHLFLHFKEQVVYMRRVVYSQYIWKWAILQSEQGCAQEIKFCPFVYSVKCHESILKTVTFFKISTCFKPAFNFLI